MRIVSSYAHWGIVSLFWFGLLAGSPAAAQQLEGRVRDAQTRASLPHATISVRDTGVGVATGPDGRYQMRLPGAGPSVLVIRHIGYETATRPVSLVPGTRTTLDVDLQPITLSVAPVEVIGTRNELAEDARSVAVLDADAVGLRFTLTVDGDAETGAVGTLQVVLGHYDEGKGASEVLSAGTERDVDTTFEITL